MIGMRTLLFAGAIISTPAMADDTFIGSNEFAASAPCDFRDLTSGACRRIPWNIPDRDVEKAPLLAQGIYRFPRGAISQNEAAGHGAFLLVVEPPDNDSPTDDSLVAKLSSDKSAVREDEGTPTMPFAPETHIAAPDAGTETLNLGRALGICLEHVSQKNSPDTLSTSDVFQSGWGELCSGVAVRMRSDTAAAYDLASGKKFLRDFLATEAP